MSKIIEAKQPCPGKDCNSSDAYFKYDDGHGYCYSCKTFFKPDGQQGLEDDGSYQYVSHRSISDSVFRKYGVKTKVDRKGTPISVLFPYGDGNFKVRDYKTKSFPYTLGDMSGGKLFGADLFTAGQSKAITIVEGEYDALAAYQMLGSTYPVVSVRSSASARKDMEAYHSFINSFEKIYLCLDNDNAGQEATSEIARLFDFNKVYHVQLSAHNDANAYLQGKDDKSFLFAWHNAKRFMPKGIISDFSEIKEVLDSKDQESVCSFPFSTLQDMTYGLHLGETFLITALEGVGKTEIVGAMEYHVLKETDVNVGIIHLEEGEKRAIQRLAGYELAVPAHLPESELAKEDVLRAYEAACKRDSRVHLYSHFGSDDPDVILDTVRFMASVCGCKIIFLDHITMVVTGHETDDERRKLDYISTRLAMMAKELNFSLVLVSHVNDDGKTRGSRNISKVAHAHLHLDRDIEAAVMSDRNTTALTIRKNRFAGHTGPAGFLHFDPKTYKIQELTEDVAAERQLQDTPTF
jgi:twinkle protein